MTILLRVAFIAVAIFLLVAEALNMPAWLAGGLALGFAGSYWAMQDQHVPNR